MRSFAALFMLLLLLSMTFIVTTCATTSYAKTKHDCAPSLPPPVAGPLVQPLPIPNTLVINEVLWHPFSLWQCSEQSTPIAGIESWVEIYNPGTHALDLYGGRTSLDSGPNTNPFYFPFGAAIAPGGYLVVFPLLSSLFAATQTTTLRLSIRGVVVDTITIPSLAPDQSYARIPDGSNNWQIVANPTIDASNSSFQTTPISTSTTTGKQDGTGATSGSGGQQNGGSQTKNGTHGTSPSSIDGTQALAGNLTLPTPMVTAVVFSTPGTISTSEQSISSSSDIPRKLFISLLLILLAVAAFWCWRLFRKT